jgi:hypothetical protein
MESPEPPMLESPDGAQGQVPVNAIIDEVKSENETKAEEVK